MQKTLNGWNEREINKQLASAGDYRVISAHSPLRTNTIEWIPLAHTQHVLLIGTEDEALLTYLSDRVQSVEQATVCYHASGHYEVILCYDPAPDQLTETLSVLKEHLAEEGRLIVISANGRGARASFRTQTTPDRAALLYAFAGAGMADPDVYYLYPDQYFTSEIYTDDYLPSKSSLTDPYRICDAPLWSEEKEETYYNQALETAGYDECCNAFIMQWRSGTQDDPLQYIKYSDERAEHLRIKTEILGHGTDRYVVKFPLNKYAISHILRMCDHYHCLEAQYRDTLFSMNRCTMADNAVRFDFLRGETLQHRIFAAIDRDDWAMIEDTIDEFYRMLTAPADSYFAPSRPFSAVFGHYTLPGNLVCTEYTDIDLIFPNIICNDDGWHIIDYEWTFHFPIPCLFVLKRALFYTFHYYTAQNIHLKKTQGKLDETLQLLDEKQQFFYQKYGITPQIGSAFDEMEAHFQRYVAGGYISLRDMPLSQNTPNSDKL